MPSSPTHLSPLTAAAPQRAGGRILARPSASLAPRVVVVGGGFAGVTAALELGRRCAGQLPVQVTLISNRNFLLFTPMLAEAATGAVESRHVLYPIRPLCGRWGIEFGEVSVEAVDLARRRLSVRHHRSALEQTVHYDRLVLALGAAPNTTVAPGAADHALTFKSAGDAIAIRNRVIDLFEAAALTDDPWQRRRLLTFVVVGAGHAGTELTAALEELARGILLRHYPTIPPSDVRLVLVGSGILPQTATNLAAYAKVQLEARGIEIETARAARVTAGGLCPRRQCGTDGRPYREPLRGHRPGGPAPGARPRAEPRGRADRPPAPPVPVQAPRRDGAALAQDRRRRPHGVEAARVPGVVPLEDDLHDEAADPGDARPRGARLDGRAVLRARRVRAGGRGRRAGGLTMETMAARGGFTARLPVWRRLGFRLGASFLALTALAVLLSGLLQYRAEAQSLRQSLGTLLLNI